MIGPNAPLELVFWISGLSVAWAPGPPDAFAQALRHLRLRYVDVKWDLDRPIVADFTGDGIEDAVVSGRRGKAFAIGVIIGPIGPLSIMQSMVWPPAGDAACVYHSAPSVAIGPLDLPPDPLGCRKGGDNDDFCTSFLEQDAWIMRVAAQGTKALRIGGDDCDEMRLYWSVKGNSFDSWTAR